ncbi:type I polyketide synthase [Chroococcus sp. FPU101]|uniref:type I polyketide synthase n=1 Tax=Chroococcus sp. FPU101 TaxID=1974212 RepID=UPI001A8E8685|nr:type I polyketide synthase [Chroococcus sp. FPU101]GFE69987.1 beta-ketoacyl synthase [Chroococcus sp. FPU101]
MTPIAIIGIGCRFKSANNPEAFWELLKNGIDTITEIEQTRWDINQYYAPTATPGMMTTRWGSFLENIDQFEPEFFQISPREAEHLDPQQRLLLEVSWEALENAGIVPHQLKKSLTGVFVGISHGDYQRLIERNLSNINAYSGTGTGFCIAANRLSYLLDLKGPSLSVDTACSSSLVALHLACQSLNVHESNLCLVGGVNLILSPETTIAFSQAKMMASDGRCKTFDASADGYVRGEGCGVVILKRLEDALRDGDNIQAMIRGTAINQDGLTNGLTAPNGISQQAVIRQALQNADVLPSDITYVETHGTGTVLGDPIEIKALKAVLIEGRVQDQSCWFGSVKTNIGHLESAAGMASLIKVILSLQHQQIPPHLHLNQLNPYISFADTPFSIPTQLQAWQTNNQTRFAGVSSFGFGGTNAHLILEEAPKPTTNPKLSRPWHLFTLSAKSEPALQDLVKRYLDYLSEPSINLANLCFSVNTGRTHFNHRLAVLTQSTQQLQQKLEAHFNKEHPPKVFYSEITRQKKPKIAFLFTGQGSQSWGMARQLYETNFIFKQTFDLCDEILKPYLEQSLKDVLYTASEHQLIHQTLYTQPALFTIEYALCQVWQAWGIKPTAVMGHSVGEYVAATVAGVFSLEDGLKLIAQRAFFVQNLPSNGAMLAIMADETTVRQFIEQDLLQIDIAAINHQRNTVVSGEKNALEVLKELLEKQNIRTQYLTVSHAFHSRLMAPILEEFEQVARQITYHTPQIPLISNLTGDVATEEIATASYWCRHLLEPVRFANSINILQEQSMKIFLEIGAKPILLGMGRQCLPTHDGYWLPSLRPEQDDWLQLLESLAMLYTAGVPINWNAVDQDYALCRLPLPTYPFQRKRYWFSENVPQTRSSASNSINYLIEQGKTEELLSFLQKNHQFSTEELQVLPKLLEILKQLQQHQPPFHLPPLEDWLYQIQWQEQTLQNNNIVATPKTYLILADTQGWGKQLAEVLQIQGNICILVYPEQVWLETTVKIDVVIYLWGLEASNEQMNLDLLEQAQIFTCRKLLEVIQTLFKYQTPQLWLVTKGSVSINDSIPNLAQSFLWGMGKVIAWEYPKLWRGLIDLDGNSSSEQISQLVTEITTQSNENQIAFRNSKRFVARLAKAKYSVPQTIPLKSERTYLITGGLGALGIKTAQWMISKGVCHLVLMGRNKPSLDVISLLSQYQQQGSNIQVIQGDVSRREDVSRVLEIIKKTMPSLAGIIHTAGVLDDGILAEQTWEKFQRVMLPKVQGIWNLHELTKDINLDFFVAFSSLTSVLGSPGQSNYAAANVFMDTLMQYRQILGLSGLSINWGLWNILGMSASLTTYQQKRLAETGIQAISTEHSLYILEQLLGKVSGQIGVFSIDWSIFKNQLSEIHQAFLANFIAAPLEAQKSILFKLEEAKKDEVFDVLLVYLREQVAKVLKLDSEVKNNDTLNSLGFDSLMAVELRNQIIKELDVQFSVEQILAGITLSELTQLILNKMVLAQMTAQKVEKNEEEIEEIII